MYGHGVWHSVCDCVCSITTGSVFATLKGIKFRNLYSKLFDKFIERILGHNCIRFYTTKGDKQEYGHLVVNVRHSL